MIDILLNKTYKVPNRIDSDGRLWYECLSDMHFPKSKTGWAVGSRQILFTADAGQTWVNRFKNQREKTSMVPHRVFATSYRVCWVLAITSQTSIRCIVTSDSGATWIGKKLGTQYPNEIFFLDSKRGWLLSDDGKMPTKNGIIHSTRDGGRTWVERTDRLPGKPSNLHFVDSTNGFVVISVPNRTGTRLHSELFASDDGGLCWQRRNMFREQILDMCVRSDGAIFVAGESGLLAMSRDGGMKWTRPEAPVAVPINIVRFQGSRLGIAGGDNGVILITVDGGFNWELPRILGDADNENIVSAHFSENSRGVIATSSSLRTFTIGKK